MSDFPADAKTVLDVIQRRRSIDLPQLRPDPIAQDVLEAILTAGTWAPNHGRTEPWGFSVFTGPGRARLGEAFAQAHRESSAPDKDSETALEGQRARVWKASAWISLELRVPPTSKMPEWEEVVAVGCAAQNMLLAATAFGLVGKWTSGPAFISPVTARELGAPRLLGFVYLAHPGADLPTRTRQPISDKVRWIAE